LNNNGEQEVLLNSSGKRFVPRLRSSDNLAAVTAPAITTTNQQDTLRLGFKLPGQLRNLSWQASPRQSLQAHECEVAVKATGLNFRDVMYTLGLLSDEAVENGFVGASLGLEFAGVITAVGENISQFKVGDRVVGLGSASFSNRVTTTADALAIMPGSMDFASAATIPSTFFTVYYSLHYQARLQAGETVLIHGAAGGVGIAAIQIAQWLGANIVATVGSQDKRDFVRLLGVDAIYDSRSLHFAEDILADTGGEGVDVVLNSLAGEAINRNFQVLKPFGRFVELGKRDFYENTRIGLRPFRNNISYFGVDADQLMSLRPQLTRQLFGEMMQLFHQGILHPLPYTTFDANQVIDAFRYMQQARQIGKIVVTYEQGIRSKASVKALPVAPLKLSANASYLITGGLTGFGLKTAQWLADKGAGALILLSRTGKASAEDQPIIDNLIAQGVSVLCASCDVSDKAALQTILNDAEKTLPPLKGIIHAAMVIEDGLARHSTQEQIDKVFTPKIEGAWHCHELTKDKALDFFVLYSSVTTLFGNPGQSNYVAANTWLEALAAYRNKLGLPATCICWGAIDDVGFLARNEKIKAALQSRMGGAALASSTALDILEQMLLNNSPTVGVMEFDWRAMSSFLPSAKSAKFREFTSHSNDNTDSDSNRADIERLLNELNDADLQSAFVELLKDELSQILLIAKEKIDANQSMYDMGLDSLMGVELMGAIENRFNVQIPVMALSDAPTLNKLAARLITQLRGDNDEVIKETPTDTIQASIKQLAKQHDSGITEQQLQALSQEIVSNEANSIIH
ncbi:MAG: type I polyketide synthase, partial [Methylococcaceae bacterium]